MILYIVAGTVGGFCREDADQAAVYGVFTDERVADKIAMVNHAKVFPVELDVITKGHLEALEAYGFRLPGQDKKE